MATTSEAWSGPGGEAGMLGNLAVHLLNDGWLDAYDCAVVVSNDSDIAESMRLVKDQHGKRIGLITPGTRSPSRQLLAHADFARRIRSNALRRSQLPDPIPSTTIRKPRRWQDDGPMVRPTPHAIKAGAQPGRTNSGLDSRLTPNPAAIPRAAARGGHRRPAQFPASLLSRT